MYIIFCVFRKKRVKAILKFEVVYSYRLTPKMLLFPALTPDEAEIPKTHGRFELIKYALSYKSVRIYHKMVNHNLIPTVSLNNC